MQSQVTEVGQEPLIIGVNGMKEATARHGTVDVLGNEEGCCCQEESMETQRQRHGVVGYDYDYGEVSSVNVKRGRLAFMPGEIGMFVVTGRPPGLLLGG